MKQNKKLFEDYKDELKPVNPAEFDFVSYPTNTSLDQLVDRYFRQYEKEAISGQYSVQESWKSKFKSFMNEADDLGLPDASAGAGDDLGLGGGLGDAGGAPAQEKKPEVLPPDINIERFAELVFGLMENYESLLDPKNTILNRAELFVAKNYSPRHADKIRTFIQTKFGFNVKEREQDMPDSYVPGGSESGGGGVSGA